MIDPFGGIRGPAPVQDLSLPGKPAVTSGVDFSKIFERAVDRVEQFQKTAEAQVDKLLQGEDQEIHEVVLSGQRAEIAFEYFLQVRNKVVQAYQEVMRMQM